MDEADWEGRTRPQFDAELVARIAELLKVFDSDKRERLASRLERYSKDYWNARRRGRHKKSPGEVRTYMKGLANRVEKLRRDVDQLDFIDEATTGYQRARRANRKGPVRPSREELGNQLDALGAIAREIIEAPQHRRGQRGKPILEHCVGSFMALFETVSGERPGYASSREGEPGDFLKGPGGKALMLVFQAIAPEVQEATLARIVETYCAEYAGRPMPEGNFNLNSAIEDSGGLEVSFTQDQ